MSAAEMHECPSCLGDGVLDFEDDDAFMAEHFTEEQMLARGIRWPLGVILCPRCKGTGAVTLDEWLDVQAASRAMVDQVLAKMEQEGRRPRGPLGGHG